MTFSIKLIGFNVFSFGFYLLEMAFNIVKQFTLCFNHKVMYLKQFMKLTACLNPSYIHISGLFK